MSNLVLLVPDSVQKTWKNYTRTHGVYSLTFGPDEIGEYCDNTCYIRDVYSTNGNKNNIQLRMSMKKLLMSMMIGNTTVDSKSIRIIGRFVKIGKVVLFEPLEEQF